MENHSNSPAEDGATAIMNRILNSPKYRQVQIPRTTLEDLIHRVSQDHVSARDLEDIVRQKVHNLVATYLGDPDYPQLAKELTSLPGDLKSAQVREFCLAVLKSHASTAERIPYLDDFYIRLFSLTGTPMRILDLACGLNPFSLPWMQLPPRVDYLAYDLHFPRVEAINTFLHHVGQDGRATHQDILVQPPLEPADVVFFFKEAHRFEQRRRGSCREFFAALDTRFLLVSLPVVSLSGRHSKLDQDRRLIEESVQGRGWQVSELLFPDEIVFCIQKQS